MPGSHPDIQCHRTNQRGAIFVHSSVDFNRKSVMFFLQLLPQQKASFLDLVHCPQRSHDVRQYSKFSKSTKHYSLKKKNSQNLPVFLCIHSNG